jgi:regulatory protein
MARRGELDPEDSKAARAAALDMLARRDHPAGEVASKLRAKGFSAGVAAQVAADLVGENLINDRRFVEHFVAYHAGRGQGPLKIRAELRQTGLDSALVEEFLDAYAQWNDRAREAREKKFGSRVCDDYAQKARQARFLAQRGFTGSHIRSALDFDPDDET